MRLAGERCEAEPNPDSGCPFPAGRVGEICVATPRFAPSAKLLVANALMLAGGEVAKDYSALLKDRYAAEVFQRASLETVNGWVRQRTEGKIEKILDKLSDVILINAVYFKSRWAVVFDKKLTKPEFFSLTRSRQEMVPTMLQRTNHAVVSREGYRAIRLPYAVRSLAMVIALPNEVEGLGDVARRLDADELTQMLAALRKEPMRPVSLMLPRFKTEYSADLKGVFQKAGMTLPFDLPPVRLLRPDRRAAAGGADRDRSDRPQRGDRGVRGIDRSRRRHGHRHRSEARRRARSSRCSSGSTGRSFITWSTTRPVRCCSRAAWSIRASGRRRPPTAIVRCSAARRGRGSCRRACARGRAGAPPSSIQLGNPLSRRAEFTRRHGSILPQDHVRVVTMGTPDGKLERGQPTELVVGRLDAGAHRLAALGTPINQHDATPPRLLT